MSKMFYELAKKNYPAFWNRATVDHLYQIGRLTEEEYKNIIGEDEE